MQKDKRNADVKTVRVRDAKSDSVTGGIQRLYNKSAPLLIAEALLFAGAAVLLLFKPLPVLTALVFVIGAGLILFGLYRTIAGCVVSRELGGGWVDVLFGLINIVLGVLFCVYPGNSLVSIVYVFVILFLFKAISALIFAIQMTRARFGHYVFDLVVSIVLVALAVFLLFFPLAGAVALVYYLAISLLLYAVVDIYMYIELLRLKKRVSE